ncbi:MAG: T9SS type A sorting domain-containing protein [Saprospiraceae bacterium]
MIKYLKIRYLLIQAICLLSLMLKSQDTVKLYLEPLVLGDTLTLSLKATNFIGVDNFNISINYSSKDLSYSFTNLNPNLIVQTAIRDSVFLNFAWTNPNAFGLTLPDNSILAEFKFFVIKKNVQTCFDFDVATRPTSFFAVLFTVIPVQTTNICQNLFGANVTGQLRLDNNGDCVTDVNEPIVAGSIIKFKGSSAEYLSISKEDGTFDRFLPYDNYTISTQATELIQGCINNTFVNLNAGNVSFNYSPSISPVIKCPLLQVDFNAPTLELCTSSQASIRYFNKGTEVVNNVYIELELDPNLVLELSDAPYTTISANKFRFDIGTINIQSANQINLLVKTTCVNSYLNRTIQNFVSIFPHNFCTTSILYSGADLMVTAACVNNENVFEIKNVGTGDMKKEIVFNTVEDDIMPNFGGKVKLNKNAFDIIKYPANGKTRIIIVDTIANHPYKVRASAGIEGCGVLPNGTVSKGYINNYAQGDQAPDKSRYSTEIKSNTQNPIQVIALPEGIGVLHFIVKDDRINYSFKVQNTTDNIVHRVVIRNTIPTTLDLATLQLVRTDLHYDWNIIDNRTLEIVFDDLNLLPLSESELGSQLYFSYSIKPAGEITVDTKIENSAKVIFDSKKIFNSSIVRHTIGNFIFTIVNDKPSDKVHLNVYPNPFADQLKFDFKNISHFRIVFSNQLGESIGMENTDQKEFITNMLSNHPNGIYYYQIFENDVNISSGKIIKTKF